MGFSFRGLTSAALANKDSVGANAAERDIAHVPASVAGHTSIETPCVDDKLGSARTYGTGSDDASLNQVDTLAEHGVQKAQAMTLVWSKKGLILAYIK